MKPFNVQKTGWMVIKFEPTNTVGVIDCDTAVDMVWSRKERAKAHLDNHTTNGHLYRIAKVKWKE